MTDAPTAIRSWITALRDLRIKAGLTQRQVAERAGLYHPIICTYERGRMVPSLPKLIAWAGALGCDVTLTVRRNGCICGDKDCAEYWRPVHERMNDLRVRSDKNAADFTMAMLEEICELRTQLEAMQAGTGASDD